MMGIGKTELLGNLRNGCVCGAKEDHGHADTGLKDISVRRNAIGFAEQADEVLRGKGEMGCNVGKSGIFPDVPVKIQADLLNGSGRMRCFCAVRGKLLDQFQKNRGGTLLIFLRCFCACAKGVKSGEKRARVAVGEDNMAGNAIDLRQSLAERACHIDPQPGKAVIRSGIVDVIRACGKIKRVSGLHGKQTAVAEKNSGAGDDVLKAGKRGVQPQLIAWGAKICFSVFRDPEGRGVIRFWSKVFFAGSRCFKADDIHGAASFPNERIVA